ncbi:flagellin [Phycisphaerales bacterium AB-hyl4]|uniref:Flagellin n=1 Tax=Natronomicrosphaera hydrolytica TaxID=3242702 RepID=A0ABV4U8D7_9BACT
MSSIPPSMFRTSTQMHSNQVLSVLRQTQSQMLDAERQIATNQKYGRPSDGAAKAPAILHLTQQLAARGQYEQNLDHALGMLDMTDATLREVNTLLLDAKTGAMGEIGMESSAESRKAQALVVDSQIKAMVDLANQKYQNIPLFGGTAGGGKPVFEEFLGGIRYTGTQKNLNADTGSTYAQPFNSNGVDAFGALSSRVQSMIDLQPQASAGTRVKDVAGATNQGVRTGTVRVSVNGQSVDVDLKNIDTLGDVTKRINNAINQLDAGAGSLNIAGDGFELDVNGGNDIVIEDIGGGKTAGDLGIRLDTNDNVGPSVNRMLSNRTSLAELGAGIDWAGGLQITHGEQTKVADFSNAQTVEDLKNVIADLDLGLRLEINNAGTGMDLVSEVSGISLSIGENGGTTASDLGLTTLGSNTSLSDFRNGQGVETVKGENDLRFTLSDGTSFDVNLDGVTQVGEMIARIEAAADVAGAGGQFSVGFAGQGNGIVFQDNTGGTDNFSIAGINQSQAAKHLGIEQSVAAGETIDSGDQAQVRVDSIFTNLIDLRNGLEKNSDSGISLAGERVEEDLDRLTQVRAHVGVEAKRVEQDQSRSKDRKLSEQTMLSNLQETDMTEVITKYAQLQHQWQASLQIGAQSMQMSLLDFLR